MKVIEWIAVILLIIGGLNWGLVGVLDFNLVTWVAMGSALIANIIYILVGVAALVEIYAVSQM